MTLVFFLNSKGGLYDDAPPREKNCGQAIEIVQWKSTEAFAENAVLVVYRDAFHPGSGKVTSIAPGLPLMLKFQTQPAGRK